MLHGSHGYIGVGAVSDKVTTSPNNYWRIVCNSSDFEIFVVLMGMHLAPHSYLQVKTTKYEGCTEKFHGRHFHKKSILIGFLSDSAILSAFRMAYVCVGKLQHLQLFTYFFLTVALTICVFFVLFNSVLRNSIVYNVH